MLKVFTSDWRMELQLGVLSISVKEIRNIDNAFFFFKEKVDGSLQQHCISAKINFP